jgi:hypothetical protein
MALPRAARETADRALALFCAQRLPEAVRKHILIDYSFHGNTVALFERRPTSFEPGEWSKFVVAQFRFDPDASTWTLFWRDRNERWHKYDEADPSYDFADLLREVDLDPVGIFWG